MSRRSEHSTIPKSERQIKGKFHPRRQKQKKEEQEFSPGKIDILVCEKCNSFYWYKSWHAYLKDYPKLKETKRIKFVLCPACQMIKDKKYEGEIILENIPETFKKDIKILAENFGKRAMIEDPMDRIISIKEEKVKRVTSKRKRGATSRKDFKNLLNIQILTTENQLAQRLAKKINETFGGELSISHSHLEDVIRARIRF